MHEKDSANHANSDYKLEQDALPHKNECRPSFLPDPDLASPLSRKILPDSSSLPPKGLLACQNV
jgi:hypothetical protein